MSRSYVLFLHDTRSLHAKMLKIKYVFAKITVARNQFLKRSFPLKLIAFYYNFIDIFFLVCELLMDKDQNINF